MTLLICGAIFQGQVPANVVSSASSYYNGNRYDFNVTYIDLERTPSWSIQADNPPLTPRKAISIALAALPQLVEEAKRWTLNKVSLRPAYGKDKWVYEVEFTGFHPPGVGDGAVPQMRIIVLLSGRAVKPVVSAYPPGR